MVGGRLVECIFMKVRVNITDYHSRLGARAVPFPCVDNFANFLLSGM
jgi:hypothetical protein